MDSHEISPNGSVPADSEQEVKETVPPTMRVVGDTGGMTEQNSKKSVTDDLSITGVTTTREQPKRIKADSGAFVRVVVSGGLVAGLVAFAISFAALYEVAEWLGLPPYMWWAVPIFIDIAILFYASSVLVHKANGERTWLAWLFLGIFTGLSVVANASHALSHIHDAPWQGIVGALIAGMAPIAIFMATEQLSRIAVEDQASRKREIQEQATMTRFQMEQDQKHQDTLFEHEQKEWERENQRLRAQRENEIAQRHHELELSEVHARSFTPGNGRQSSVSRERVDSTNQVSPKQQTPDDDALVAFIRDQVAAGQEITGALVGDFLGVSDRTGRRRVKDLQIQSPDLLTVPDAVNASAHQLQEQA